VTAGLFPDTADVFCDLLAGFFLDGHLGLSAPGNLGDVLPFGRIGGLGGSDDRITDRSTVDVDVFHLSIPASNLLAEQIRQFLISGPHTVNGVVIDSVRTVLRPRQLPWPTTGVFRSAATYRVSARRSTT
jgi:hypothetical protein